MQSYDIMKYFSKAIVGFGLLSAYDTLVGDKDFVSYSLKDGGTFALSIVMSEWVVDILCSYLPINEGMQGMLSRPLISAVIYMYLFNYFIRPNY